MSREAFKETLDATMIHNAGMHKLPQVLRRIQRFYCIPMTSAGLCPAKCNLCTKHLNEVITNIDPARAKLPYAVLVWRLRSSTSTLVETQSRAKKAGPIRDAFGQTADVDPLDLILAELE